MRGRPGGAAGTGLPAESFLEGKTHKQYCDGTHRSCEPAETLAAVRPHLVELGITRIANVTGLDRIGIPVVMVVRPNSRSLAVAQGKGLTLAAAQASGVMESVETHHAERTNCPVWIESWRHLKDEARVADPDRLPLSLHSRYTPSGPLPWVEAVNLIDGEPVWVPYELVHANTTVPRVPGSGCFVAGTNGLASGNNRSEAVLHGLCEVIERDATAMWRQDGRRHQATRLDLVTVNDPACASLLEMFAGAGFAVMAWDTTCDTAVPAFHVVILEGALDPVLRPMPAASGFGCHPDPAIALSRALTEAAQSRLTQISGSRDDLTRPAYRDAQNPAGLEHFGRIAADTGVVDFRTMTSFSCESIEDDIAHIIERLGVLGIDEVLAVDLSRATPPVAVVRVIVPGLEGPAESPAYTPGRRARRLKSSLEAGSR